MGQHTELIIGDGLAIKHSSALKLFDIFRIYDWFDFQDYLYTDFDRCDFFVFILENKLNFEPDIEKSDFNGQKGKRVPFTLVLYDKDEKKKEYIDKVITLLNKLSTDIKAFIEESSD